MAGAVYRFGSLPMYIIRELLGYNTRMCGRFTLHTPATELFQLLLLDLHEPLIPRYNIAPTQSIATVRQLSKQTMPHLAWLQWGLIPSWATKPAKNRPLINARAETVADKPSFRDALARQRCLILCDGYYEWQASGKKKQAFYIRQKDERPFAFAGIWDRWYSESNSAMDTCAIITTAANDLTRPIHERMPVILDQADYAAWLDPLHTEKKSLVEMLQPFHSAEMKLDRISAYVNRVQNDDVRCIQIQRDLF